MNIINKDVVLIGKIVDAHGVHGAVKVASYSEDPINITKYGSLFNKERKQVFTIKTAKIMKQNIVIVKFDNITNRDMAEELKNTDLFIDRETLPIIDSESEFYQADLINLDVFIKEKTNEPVGKVIAISNFGAGDLIEVYIDQKNSQFFPFTKDVVKDVNINEKYIIINPLEEV